LDADNYFPAESKSNGGGEICKINKTVKPADFSNADTILSNSDTKMGLMKHLSICRVFIAAIVFHIIFGQ
jgi:hypothetical protein